VVPVQGTLHSNNGILERTAALNGIGLVLLPTFYVGDELRAGTLRSVLDEYSTEITIYAVYPERRNLSPKVRAFVDFLRERIGERPYWDRELGTSARREP
jgi:DNA-binding transcriptional LysR family regulator